MHREAIWNGTGLAGQASMAGHVLVVDDDATNRERIADYLKVNDYRVTPVDSGKRMLEILADEPVDLVALELKLRGEDGLQLARQLREAWRIPLIIVTSRAEEADRVMGLELGADDYITKPFSVREFSSRIKAALRRAEMTRPAETAPDEAPLTIRELRIDFPKRTVRVRGNDVQLTFVEFEILSALARGPGRVFTRDMLLDRIWGDSAYRDPRTIDVHIRHLREKIERDAKDPEYLFTVRGVGYRFRDTEL
jgi:DNA-binding response OmpR family regulator